MEANDDDDDDDTDNGNDNYSGMLRCYDEVVNYFLDTYADECMFSQTDASISALPQRDNQSSVALKDIVFTRTILCGRVYRQENRIHIFLQGLSAQVCNKAGHFYSEHATATLDRLAGYVNDIDRKIHGTLYTNDDRRKARQTPDIEETDRDT